MGVLQHYKFERANRKEILALQLRRNLIRRLTAVGLLFLTRHKHVVASNNQSSHDVGGYRISAEFEPTKAIWLGYDVGHKELTVALVKALKPYVSLKLVSVDAANNSSARDLLVSNGIALDNVEFLTEPKSLFFCRDVAVFANAPKKPLNAIIFRWQYYGMPGWCKRRHGEKSERLNECIGAAVSNKNDFGEALARQASVQTLQSNLIIEGGAIETNGKGLILANESLVMQRNPGRNRVALEHEYLALPGVQKVIWLPEGLAEDPHLRATIIGNYVGWGTGGHTDEFVRFTDARTVMLAWPNDADVATHPVARLNRQRMQRCFNVLSKATDVEGKRLNVLKVPMPKVIERPVFLTALADGARSAEWSADYFPDAERRREGDRLIQVAAASYMNFIIANGVVVVPSYIAHGTPRTTEARVIKMFEAAFPGRKIQLIDAIGANWVGGGPHCATLREPA
jgi:agmatine deiminase